MKSVVSYPERGKGGNSHYRGNFAPQLVEDLVQQFKPRWVVDPMAGSGTTLDVCRALGIRCWSSDLSRGFDILADEIPAGGDLGILHPPYHDMIVYSGQMWGQADERDLSRCRSYDEFLQRLDEAQRRLYDSLRRGGHLAVLVGDLKRQGQLYPIQRDMRWWGTPVNLVVKLQHNCWSDNVAYGGNFIPIVHEYLVVTKKADAWFVAVRTSSRESLDGRQMAHMTWQGITQSGLEALGGKAPLPELYQAVQDHARVQQAEGKGIDWRAQVRRELQVNPRRFTRVTRGEWALVQ